MLGCTFLITSDVFLKMAFGQVEMIPSIIPVYYREVQNHMFTPSAFYISCSINTLAIAWFYPVCEGFMTFYFLGLSAHSFWDCCQFVLILFCNGMAGSFMGLMFGTIFPEHDSAFQYMMVVSIFIMSSSGFFANTNPN